MAPKGKACISLLYSYLFAGAAVLEVVGYAPLPPLELLLSAVSEITRLYNYMTKSFLHEPTESIKTEVLSQYQQSGFSRALCRNVAKSITLSLYLYAWLKLTIGVSDHATIFNFLSLAFFLKSIKRMGYWVY